MLAVLLVSHQIKIVTRILFFILYFSIRWTIEFYSHNWTVIIGYKIVKQTRNLSILS